MKPNLIAILTFSLITLYTGTHAQDTILHRNGEKIICLVKEIGTKEIRFTRENFRSDLVFTIERKDVIHIAFSDGEIWENEPASEMKENVEQNPDNLYNMQNRNAWKMDFLSPVANTAILTYERALKNGNSLEFSAGYIGIGIADKSDDANGILFTGGYKLIKSMDFFNREIRYPHILKGRYLKFELGFASYGYNDYYSNNSDERLKLSKWAIMTVLGQQWVFTDSFVIDIYSGIGIGGINKDFWEDDWPYGFSITDSSFPMAFSVGIRLGLMSR